MSSIISPAAGRAGEERPTPAEPGLNLRARADLLALKIASRLYLPAEVPVHLAGITVWLARRSFRPDMAALAEIHLEECYRSEYAGAMVVDIGGHKGYYGAYALLRGAAAVFTFEPEARNFCLLERAARAVRPDLGAWHTFKTAVAPHSGWTTFYVTDRSTSHSLVKREDRSIQQEIPAYAISLGEVLARAQTPGCRLIVKLDVEGAEGEIVLGTAVDAWRQADEVLLEWHPFSDCSEADLTAHLARAGLELRPARFAGVHCYRRVHRP